MSGWKEAFQHELQMAAAARARENEGQARVCARRAAGAVVRAYFARRELAPRASNALDLLQALLELADLPPEARRSAEELTLRVNEAFQLPAGIDLLQAARGLGESLFPGELES
jgi:hypothetical protein